MRNSSKLMALLILLASMLPVIAQEQDVIIRPQMRAEPLTDAIDYIDTEQLSSYFDNIAIFDRPEDFNELPYIIGFDNDATMGATGDIAYSRGIDLQDNISAYTILAPGKIFKDPDTKEVLGYVSEAIGNVEMTIAGDVQTLYINYALSPIDVNTKLIPRIGLDLPSIIDVRKPQTPMSGRVLQVENDNVGVGHYAVAIISIGERDGARRGDLLTVLEAPTYVRDPNTNKDVLLPSEAFGKLLVYKTYAKISLAIVIEANKPVRISDKIVGTPA